MRYFCIRVLIFGNELTSLDMGGTGQKQLLLILEVAVSIFFAIFAILASFDAQARRGRLTREGQSSFYNFLDKPKSFLQVSIQHNFAEPINR